MKIQAKLRVPMVPTVFEGSESLTKLKSKKSSAQRVQEHRKRERQKPGYNHEKVKEIAFEWQLFAHVAQTVHLAGNVRIHRASYTLIVDAKLIRYQKPKNQRAQVKEKEVSIIYLNKEIFLVGEVFCLPSTSLAYICSI